MRGIARNLFPPAAAPVGPAGCHSSRTPLLLGIRGARTLSGTCQHQHVSLAAIFDLHQIQQSPRPSESLHGRRLLRRERHGVFTAG